MLFCLWYWLGSWGEGLFRNSLTNLQLGIGSGPWLRAQVELTVDSLLIQVPLFRLPLLLPEDVVQREKAEPPVLIKQRVSKLLDAPLSCFTLVKTIAQGRELPLYGVWHCVQREGMDGRHI